VGFQRHIRIIESLDMFDRGISGTGSASDASARPRFLAIRAAPETSDVTGGAE